MSLTYMDGDHSIEITGILSESISRKVSRQGISNYKIDYILKWDSPNKALLIDLSNHISLRKWIIIHSGTTYEVVASINIHKIKRNKCFNVRFAIHRIEVIGNV